MSYRSDAITAFDSMSHAEWLSFAPKRSKREEFRTLLVEGRVDPRQVLHNVEVARRIEQAQQAMFTEMDRQVEMPVRAKSEAQSAVLEVVA